ncbi:replication factor C large subunit [Methanosarcina sp. MSH10X1]|uniref:replication factor C large subunit n=1 Tax=Methanosarcina sp. MSH10X1 TaxID=2507075 RepID=UPI000FFB2FC2|nr:replication factor C large subunit [Methanosarcina sp. MSH10X1]RXA20203.1 replication factor C large subunit [Methanosarcina sp. MSH10X1]
MTLAIEWAEKYRPQTLKEIVGNKKAVQDLRTWAEEWLSGIPERRAVILQGPAGVGKTSTAHALARDLGWEVIELNASDQRTAGVIEKVAGSAASMNTFFGGKRLIILDEADNLHGTADRGGMRAIAGIIKSTLQPIVLIANDVYGLTPTIRNLCLEIKFGSVQSRSMVPALKKVCESEEISCSLDAIQQIAENAGGDLRSAINDLQAAASGRKVLEAEDISTSGRDVKENIFKAMQRIFKSTDCKKALEAARGLDESPEDLVHWIDENLPVQYASKDRDLGDIRTGFGYLSKADLYLGRVKKRQNYGMWRYASMLMVCGAAISKTKPYPGFIKYQSPSLWKRMGQIRSKRDLRDNIASKVGEHSFESMRYSRNNLLELYSRMLKEEESAVEITAGLGLELEELIYLSGSTKPSKKLQKIYDRAQELLLEGKQESDETEFFRTPVSSGDNKELLSGCTVKAPDEKAGKSSEEPGTTDSGPSQERQKTLNFGFELSPEISGEIKKSRSNDSGTIISQDLTDTLTPGSFTSDAIIPEQYEAEIDGIGFTDDSLMSSPSEPDNLNLKDVSLRPESFEGEAFFAHEPIGSTISPEPPLQEPLNCKPAIKNTRNKPENPGVESRETPKKAESKTQKTLFDF